MKVLLLGAKGMLGHALQQEFAAEDVTAWDRDELDITDEQAVVDKITALSEVKGQLDVIINAAAYTAVDAAEKERELAFAVNETGVRNIAVVAKKIGAKMVHYSTDYVFTGNNREGYDENATPGPTVNVYAASKLAGERALQEMALAYYLIRTAWLFGPGGKNFVDTILKLASSREELRVVNDQFGNPTYTVDLARMTHAILTDSSFTPGVYHVVNREVATWYDLAQETVTLANRQVVLLPVPSTEYPLPAQRPQYSVLHTTKIPALRPWREALKEYIKEKNYE